MVLGRNFCEKRQIRVRVPHFGEVRGDARPWWMARWKAYGQLSIALIELFSLSIAVPELCGEMYTTRVFSQGVDFFAF